MIVAREAMRSIRRSSLRLPIAYHGPEWLTGGPRGTEASALKLLTRPDAAGFLPVPVLLVSKLFLGNTGALGWSASMHP
jgi:hypothetical protein